MESYNTKELGLLLQSIGAKLDQFIFDNKEAHQCIKEENHEQHQTMTNKLVEHNGRLRKSEKAAYGIKVMISTAVGIFVVIILPIMVWYANTVSASIDSLEAKLETKLENGLPRN